MSALVSPLNAKELMDEYFIENRNRLLDLAAFLDRLDRAPGGQPDYRRAVLADAVAMLADGAGSRVKRIQMLLSDPTSEPLDKLDRKSALGAYDPGRRQPEVQR